MSQTERQPLFSFIMVGAEENFCIKSYLSSAAAPSRCLIISLVSRRMGPVCERSQQLRTICLVEALTKTTQLKTGDMS